MQTSAQSVNELQDGLRSRFENGFHHRLAGRIPRADRDRCLMNIQPNILGVIHEGAPGRLCCEKSKPTPTEALFDNALIAYLARGKLLFAINEQGAGG